MDNQHKQIKGYRDLSQEEINLMNKIKALAEQVGELVKEIQSKTSNDYMESDPDDEYEWDSAYAAVDWAINAKKDLQLGFMMLTRAVAKPTTF